MWGVVRKALRGLDPIRIENRCELGTPDVNIALGDWIELKIAKAPKRGGILKIDHYTQEQRTWAIRRHHAGGRCWVLLKVSSEWLLLRGEVAAEFLCYVNLEKLRELSVGIWKIKLNQQELRKILQET
jgi:hypothetical protein